MEKNIETPKGKFIIRPYRDEDERKVIELWELAFQKKMEENIWRWKFRNNPFGRYMMLCLAENGTPVVMYGGIPYSANWNGQDIKMGHIMDTMTHPEYRHTIDGRKGLLVLTAEHFYKIFGGRHKCTFLFGFPGQRVFRLGTMLLKYEKVAEGGAYLIAETRNLKLRFWPFFGSEVTIKSVDHSFDQLWKSVHQFYPLAIKRDRRFVQWRFFEHPTNHYQFYLGFNFSGKITGYIAVLIDDKTATIVDALTIPSQSSVSRLLLKLKKDLLRNDIQNVQIWLPKQHFMTTFFLNSGFTLTKEPLGFIPAARLLCENPDIEYVSKNIFYTMADGDLF